MLMDHEIRPCHRIGETPNACAAAHYRRVIENHIHLSGAWAGWRLAGRDLVSPDRERISPERLRGLLFRQASEDRVSSAAARNRAARAVSILPLPARERFEGLA